MRLHENFEWDEAKAEKNLKKHRVSFGDAALVLADDEADATHVEEFDPSHSDVEERYLTTASHPDDRSIVLRISWTDRSTRNAKVTRIISTRLATKAEKAVYAKAIGGK